MAVSAMTAVVARNASPFLLTVHDTEILAHSDGFAILRAHLAQHYQDEYVQSQVSHRLTSNEADERHDSLCDDHTPAHLENSERWLMIRDVLHALLVPIVELFDKACTVASQATKAARLEDLEFAFTGQARSAFIWLQCFLSSEKERSWCYTRGCPACVIEHSLDSEFSIRLLYAACLLSDVHYPFTLEGPTLPSFMFFLDSLRHALQQDPLWGADFFELTHPKALATRNGVEELIHQCLELDLLLSQPSSPYMSSPEASRPPSPVIGPMGGHPGMRVKRSKVARQQMRVQIEQEQWMEDMLNRCSQQLLSHATSNSVPIAMTTQSLDAVLKDDTLVTVAVSELVTET